MSKSDYGSHVLILAWINIVFSSLCAAVGFFAFFLLTGIGVVSEDPQAGRVLGFVGTAAAIFLIAVALPGILAGYGLLKRRAWGRVVGIVVGILGLINFPIGTGVGIYALWVLSRPEAATYFGGDVSPPRAASGRAVATDAATGGDAATDSDAAPSAGG